MKYLQNWNKLISSVDKDNWTTLSCFPNYRFKNLQIIETNIEANLHECNKINISLIYDHIDVLETKINKNYEIY
jgi:hypothetical protein